MRRRPAAQARGAQPDRSGRRNLVEVRPVHVKHRAVGRGRHPSHVATRGALGQRRHDAVRASLSKPWRFAFALDPVRGASGVAHEAVVGAKPPPRGEHVRHGPVGSSAPHAMSPLLRGVPLVPEVLAVEIPLAVQPELVRVDVRNGNRLAPVGRDLPDPREVRVEDAAPLVHHDPDARVGNERRRAGQKKRQRDPPEDARPAHCRLFCHTVSDWDNTSASR